MSIDDLEESIKMAIRFALAITISIFVDKKIYPAEHCLFIGLIVCVFEVSIINGK
jgi:hypothetical protein